MFISKIDPILGLDPEQTPELLHIASRHLYVRIPNSLSEVVLITLTYHPMIEQVTADNITTAITVVSAGRYQTVVTINGVAVTYVSSTHKGTAVHVQGKGATVNPVCLSPTRHLYSLSPTILHTFDKEYIEDDVSTFYDQVRHHQLPAVIHSNSYPSFDETVTGYHYRIDETVLPLSGTEHPVSILLAIHEPTGDILTVDTLSLVEVGGKVMVRYAGSEVQVGTASVMNVWGVIIHDKETEILLGGVVVHTVPDVGYTTLDIRTVTLHPNNVGLIALYSTALTVDALECNISGGEIVVPPKCTLAAMGNTRRDTDHGLLPTTNASHQTVALVPDTLHGYVTLRLRAVEESQVNIFIDTPTNVIEQITIPADQLITRSYLVSPGQVLGYVVKKGSPSVFKHKVEEKA